MCLKVTKRFDFCFNHLFLLRCFRTRHGTSSHSRTAAEAQGDPFGKEKQINDLTESSLTVIKIHLLKQYVDSHLMNASAAARIINK